MNVNALSPANILAELRRGAIAAAWLPEPWATRAVFDCGAKRWVDERDEWSERRFPSAMLVARRDFVRERPAEAQRCVDMLEAEIKRAQIDGASARRLASEEISRVTQAKLPAGIVDEAWRYIDFTNDVMSRATAKFAADAHSLGYLRSADCSGLFVT